MAEQRGQRDRVPEARTGETYDWQEDMPGSGRAGWDTGRQTPGPPPGWAGPPGYPAAAPAGGRPSGRGFTRAAVALAAAVAAAIIALIAVNLAHQSPAVTAGNAPPAHAPAPAGNGGAGPIAGPGGNGGGTLFMGGQVTKVSDTSITLTAQGHHVTAAITRSTTFSGVHSPTGIKVGDQVTAQITGYGTGNPVAAAIQDPAQIP